MINLSTLKHASCLSVGSFLGMLLSSAHVGAKTIIETVSAWDRSSFVVSFGEPNTTTYGQSFIAPNEDNFLTSFVFFLDVDDKSDTTTFVPSEDSVTFNSTYFLDESDNSENTTFAVYVAEFNGSTLIGPILFESGPLSTTLSPGFEKFAVSTGGVELVSGNQYVAFFSASDFLNGVPTTNSAAALLTDEVYSGGRFVYQNNGSDFNQLFSIEWFSQKRDLVFELEFDAGPPESTPEPMSLLSLLGITAVTAVRRHFRWSDILWHLDKKRLL